MITLIAIHGSQVFHVASRDPKAGPLCGRGKDSAVQQHLLPGDDAQRATFHKRRPCAGCAKRLEIEVGQAQEMAHTFARVLADLGADPDRPRLASSVPGVAGAYEMMRAGLLEHSNERGYLLTDSGRRAAGVATTVTATDVAVKALLSGNAQDMADVEATAEALRQVNTPPATEDEVTADLKARGLVFGTVRGSMSVDEADRRCPVKLDPRSADDTEPWIAVHEDGSAVELDAHDIEAGIYVTRFAHFEVEPATTLERAVYAHLPARFAELDGRLNAQQRALIDGATTTAVHGEAHRIAAENLANVGSLAELVSLGLAYRSNHSVHGHHYLTQAGRNLATYRKLFVVEPSRELARGLAKAYGLTAVRRLDEGPAGHGVVRIDNGEVLADGLTEEQAIARRDVMADEAIRLHQAPTAPVRMTDCWCGRPGCFGCNPRPPARAVGHLVEIESFGYLHTGGVALTADAVLDVRSYHDPARVAGMLDLTGHHPEVRNAVLSTPGVEEEIARTVADVPTDRPWRIAVGCGGGKHRAVAITEEIATRLRRAGRTVRVLHPHVARPRVLKD